MSEMEMNWYVLCAVSGREGKVKEYIDTEIARGRYRGFVSQVLIPTEKVQVQRGKKIVEVERVSLPGYVFVEAKLVGEVAHELRSTPNCFGFLGGTTNPTPMGKKDVQRMLKQEEENVTEIAVDIEIPYALGDKVKVKDGPFAGFSGEIEDVNQEKRTVTVTVKVFDRPQGLTLSFMQVERE